MKIRESEKLRVEVYKSAGYACASVPVAFVLHLYWGGVIITVAELIRLVIAIALGFLAREFIKTAHKILVKEES